MVVDVAFSLTQSVGGQCVPTRFGEGQFGDAQFGDAQFGDEGTQRFDSAGTLNTEGPSTGLSREIDDQAEALGEFRYG
ncbi:hypothetical protein Pla52o_50670 [Novipirellula galeiformis]|uniref:Uncharacterized protein n=1 Tax=Novipirellula galeiformis TaxID=2528004 RepID=A0A5C6C1K9_9BACT|nr:hypothetical protein [Novipirellula galeiformis]TWU17511.1 hypothetical protein Pla52o_50670 [Novipirellula galeiformis]